MKFTRWTDIENDYQDKILDYWVSKYPELLETEFEITEKIHGSNFSIIVGGDTVKFAKRSTVVEDNFYNFQEVMNKKEYQELINFLIQESISSKTNFQLYGELYGSGIQKGVYYGADKYFRWYGLRIEKKGLIAPKQIDEFLKDFMHLKVPVIAKINSKDFNSLREMLDSIDINFNSTLTPEGYDKENICEGVVICPYNAMIKNQHDYFMIKKKNEKFKDKHRAKKVNVQVEYSEKLKNVIRKISSYVNEMRREDLYSKEGELTDIKNISAYSKLYFKDVMKDFNKDHEHLLAELQKIEKREVNKILGKLIFTDLRISLLRK